MNTFFLLTPLEARQQSYIYTAIIVAVIAAGFFMLLAFLIRVVKLRRQQFLNDPERPTLKSDINRISKELKLTAEEKSFLHSICAEYKAPNFLQTVKNMQKLDEFFKSVYDSLDTAAPDKHKAEQQKALLFAIREKLGRNNSQKNTIKSSSHIPEGITVEYIADDNMLYTMQVLKNTKEGIVLQVPKNIFGSEIKPPVLSKISLSFEMKNSTAYTMQTRVIRYQQHTESEMVIAHTANIVALNRRKQMRILFSQDCIFSAVQVVTGGTGKQPKIEYKPLEKKYTGTLIDISGGGCKLKTNLNIRENQYIYLHIHIIENSPDEVAGRIIKTVPDTDAADSFILHIQFVHMPQKTRNRIFSKVYEYSL